MKDIDHSIDPASCGATGEDAAAVARLSPQALELAYRTAARAHHEDAARRYCEVLLDGNADCLESLSGADFAAIAADFEADHDENETDSAQWERAATDYLNGKFHLWDGGGTEG